MEQGYKWIPYKIVIVATSINGEIVWYKNKWKNLLLKIKRLFVKPKHLKNGEIYSKKKINSSYYGKVIINNDDNIL